MHANIMWATFLEKDVWLAVQTRYLYKLCLHMYNHAQGNPKVAMIYMYSAVNESTEHGQRHSGNSQLTSTGIRIALLL